MKELRDPSHTREKILDAAQRLMLTKGYTATTVNEICREAGLTKGSFFHYFESKEGLGITALNRFASNMFMMMKDAEFNRSEDPLARIYGFLDFTIGLVMDPVIPKSCLIGNFSQELSETHPEIRSLCASYFARWTDTLKKDLDEAKTRHAPQVSFDTQSLASHFIATIEGSLILAKANQNTKVIEGNILHLRQYLKTLFSGEKSNQGITKKKGVRHGKPICAR
jgi:TetR/AcrR family transcriptional repressor of nem operon